MLGVKGGWWGWAASPFAAVGLDARKRNAIHSMRRAGDPELAPDEAAKHLYTVYGKVHITDSGWSPVDGDASEYNFFRVDRKSTRLNSSH